MKKLIIFLLILASITLILPKFIGGVVESEHQTIVNKLNENPALTIKSSSFTRHWFTAEAITEITILLQNEDIHDITITIDENVSFGPVILTNKGLNFALGYSQARVKVDEDFIDTAIEDFIKDKIQLNGLITFAKHININMNIDELTNKVDGNTVTFKKAVAHFTIENNNRLFGNFDWDGLNASNNEESLSLGPVSFSLDQTLIVGDYYHGNAISTGDFNFKMAAIISKLAAGNTIFAIDNIVFNAESALQDDLMTIALNSRADKVSYIGQTLESAKLAAVFKDFNISIMQEINTILAALSTEAEPTFSEIQQQKLSQLITTLLADDPRLEISELSVQTSEGKIASSMQVSFNKSLFEPNQVMSIIPAIQVEAHGAAPMTFFEKLDLTPIITAYKEQGLLVQKDKELEVSISFAQAKLTINGQNIPL